MRFSGDVTMNYTTLPGGRLLDIAAGTAEFADVLIEGDMIREVGPPGRPAHDGAVEISAARRPLAGFLSCALALAARRHLGFVFRLLAGCSWARRSLARASILARASASFCRRASRRSNSSGTDISSGISAWSAASALTSSIPTSAFSCTSSLPACS
jgi:hypothetical protein